jgi:hypothetical protein
MFRLQTEETSPHEFTSLEVKVVSAQAHVLAGTCTPCSQLVDELNCSLELLPLLFGASHLW